MVVNAARNVSAPLAEWTADTELRGDGLANEGAFVREPVEQVSQFGFHFESDQNTSRVFATHPSISKRYDYVILESITSLYAVKIANSEK